MAQQFGNKTMSCYEVNLKRMNKLVRAKSTTVTNQFQTNYLNTELSLLSFHERVLNMALNPRTPLLERLKFLCIFSSNMDEFFEIRVSGLKAMAQSAVSAESIDGLTPQIPGSIAISNA